MTQLCWGCEIIRPSHDDGVVQACNDSRLDVSLPLTSRWPLVGIVWLRSLTSGLWYLRRQVKLQCAAGSTRALLRVSGTWRQFTDLLCETRCYEACVRFFSFPMDAKRSEFLLEPSQVL